MAILGCVFMVALQSILIHIFTKSPALGEENSSNWSLTQLPMERIANGSETAQNEFPFMAYLPIMGCGGSIISTKFVVTAAHCIDEDENIVTVGVHNISDPSEGRTVKARATYTHPEYYGDGNDIALIELEEPLIFNSSVSPVCLPFAYAKKNFTGDTVTIIGWGNTDILYNVTNVLQKANSTVIPNEKCDKAYETFKGIKVSKGDMCLWSKDGKSTCTGDSGGPALWYDGQRDQLVGITSRGSKVCDVSEPGIYTRVTEYLSWITKITQLDSCPGT